jgi:hypothetical protein
MISGLKTQYIVSKELLNLQQAENCPSSRKLLISISHWTRKGCTIHQLYPPTRYYQPLCCSLHVLGCSTSLQSLLLKQHPSFPQVHLELLTEVKQRLVISDCGSCAPLSSWLLLLTYVQFCFSTIWGLGGSTTPAAADTPNFPPTLQT